MELRLRVYWPERLSSNHGPDRGNDYGCHPIMWSYRNLNRQEYHVTALVEYSLSGRLAPSEEVQFSGANQWYHGAGALPVGSSGLGAVGRGSGPTPEVFQIGWFLARLFFLASPQMSSTPPLPTFPTTRWSRRLMDRLRWKQRTDCCKKETRFCGRFIRFHYSPGNGVSDRHLIKFWLSLPCAADSNARLSALDCHRYS